MPHGLMPSGRNMLARCCLCLNGKKAHATHMVR